MDKHLAEADLFHLFEGGIILCNIVYWQALKTFLSPSSAIAGGCAAVLPIPSGLRLPISLHYYFNPNTNRTTSSRAASISSGATSSNLRSVDSSVARLRILAWRCSSV
jgi:hypothetical protein